MFLIGFPLLIVPLAIYNMIAFLTPGLSWSDKVVTVKLFSGAEWTLTFADVLIAIALFLLCVEIAKAARLGIKSIVDHCLSLFVFLLAGAEFLLVAQAATSIFAVLVAICLLDAVSGFLIGRRIVPPPVASPPIEKSEP